MRRAVLIAVILAAAAALIFVPVATPANFIVGCLASHTNNDDPIVFPGQPGASHNHTFVGARTTNAFSTFDSLVSSQTTCGTPGDRSGYWQPNWYPVHPNKGLLVYMNVSSQTRIFPDGLKMIVRWSGGRIRFKCGPRSNTETLAPPASCSSLGSPVGMISAVRAPQSSARECSATAKHSETSTAIASLSFTRGNSSARWSRSGSCDACITAPRSTSSW